VKAFEKTIFNPRTLVRTWGTRPISYWLLLEHRFRRDPIPPVGFGLRGGKSVRYKRPKRYKPPGKAAQGSFSFSCR
jgi:hypothetical protein